MKATIKYRQTREERYDTTVNEDAETAIRLSGCRIVGSEGGSLLGGTAVLAADQEFQVEGTQTQIGDAKASVRRIIGSPETLAVEYPQ